MLNEFKQFALKGNVVDLAIGVIIGAAFGRIVDSTVSDLFMPVIGAILGGLDFTNYFLPLASSVTAASYEEAQKQGAVLGYGRFITIAVNFMIIAWILFVVVKLMNRLKRQEAAQPAPTPVPTGEEKLLAEIRDILRTGTSAPRA